MKAISLAVICIILLAYADVCPQSYQESSDMPIFSQSVATVNDLSAGLINPAGLASRYVMGLRYIHSFSDSSVKGDNGFLFGMKGVMMSVQWMKHGNGLFRRKYLIASGKRLFSNFYWGLSYARFSKSGDVYNKQTVWKAGFLYRPRPQVSFGLVVDDINRPEFGDVRLERNYTFGIGLRPLGNKLTFSVDGFISEKDDITSVESLFRLEVKPKAGLNLVADYKTEGFFRLGLAVAFGQAEIGIDTRSSESDFLGGSFYFNQGPMVARQGFFSGKRIGKIRIDGSLRHEVRGSKLFGPRRISFLRILRDIRKATDDPAIVGLFLEIERFPLGIASVQELRKAIQSFRSAGKKVIARIDMAGNLEYYLASAADEIYLSPAGYLDFRGLKAELTYLGGTLDKLGLYADFVGIGEYKTAPEILTRQTMSEAESLQTNALLDDIYSQMVSDIAKSRGFSAGRIKELIDEGPYSPNLARDANLVNGLVYKDEMFENRENYFCRKFRVENLARRYRHEYYADYWGDPAEIAVVYATGEIVGKHSRDGPIMGRTMGEETVAGALRKARTDNDIKAVVLRINSPGGEVFATDGIYRELEKIKRKKPLIISVGDIAASGGYYIACIGDDILMMPAAITGSIGIFTGKLVVTGLYEKVGANKVILKRGRHADIRSDWRLLNDEERRLVYRQLEEFYDSFVGQVARWRRLEKSRVDSIGRGRVWSGERAVQLGLSDSHGNIMEAIDLAVQRANIRPHQPVSIEIFPRYKFDFLRGYKSGESTLAEIFVGKIPGASFLSSLKESSYFYRLPYDIEIK